MTDVRFPKPLPKEEQTALVMRAKEGDEEARKRLIATSMGFLYGCARNYARASNVDVDDIAHDGVFGLIDAIDGFDPSFGYRFLTYASSWVHKAMRECVCRAMTPISAPTGMLAKVRSGTFKRAREALSNADVSTDVDAKIARDHGMTVELLRASESLAPAVSMDQPFAWTDQRSLHDVLGTASVHDELLDDDLRGRVRQIIDDFMATLSEKHRIVVERRLLQGETLESVGIAVNLTRERIRQIEKRLLSDLRVVIVRRLSDGSPPTRSQAMQIVPDFMR